MEKNDNRFQEQEAPRKNTDNAFVKVGEDGKPEIPQSEEKQQPQPEQGKEEKEA